MPISRQFRQHDWTSLHNFYASMGGFVFDFHHEGGDFGSPFVPMKYIGLP